MEFPFSVHDLSQQSLLRVFDQLNAEGVLVYRDPIISKQDFSGFPVSILRSMVKCLTLHSCVNALKFEFHISSAYANKPQYNDSSQPSGQKPAPKFGPGSDIDCADERMKICVVNRTHLLVFNKFCIQRPQYLLLTLDSYQQQTEPLSLEDLNAAWQALNVIESTYIIYNCSQIAGCSRKHKHMQLLQLPDHQFQFLSNRSETNTAEVPFQYFSQVLSQESKSLLPSRLHSIYESLLRECHDSNVLNTSTGLITIPHNVILLRDWICVIPRRREAVRRASANAAGMLGCVWVSSQDQVDEWLRLSPLHVLAQLGWPPRTVRS